MVEQAPEKFEKSPEEKFAALKEKLVYYGLIPEGHKEFGDTTEQAEDCLLTALRNVEHKVTQIAARPEVRLSHELDDEMTRVVAGLRIFLQTNRNDFKGK